MNGQRQALMRSMVKNPGGLAMVFYFVQRGETLYAIAKRYQTTVHAIVAANRLEDPNAICPGQALIIPRPGEVPLPPPGGIVHLVRPGETVFHLARKFGTGAPEILRANQIAHPEFILPGQQLVIPEPAEVGDEWPMLGRTPGRAGAGPIELEGVPLPGWSYSPRKRLGIRPSAPVVRYDRVYAGLGDGHFYCLDRNSGRAKWRLPAGTAEALAGLGDRPLAAPAVYEGLAYLCSPDGVIQSVDAYTGHQIWKVAMTGPISSAPAVSGGLLYAGCWDGHLCAVEAKTGAVAWRRDLGAGVRVPVAVGDEQVYAVTEKGQLWALDAQTGDLCWQSATDADRQPVFAEVIVIAGGQAYDPQDGSKLWQVETGEIPPVARVDQVIYPDSAVDLFAGTRRWIRESETGPVHQIVSGTLVLGVGPDQRLHASDVTDGHLVWSIDLAERSSQPPAVAHGQIFVTLGDGSLQSFRMKT